MGDGDRGIAGRRGANGRVHRRRQARSRHRPHRQPHRRGALLRRGGRHAVGHSFAPGQPHQPRLGAGAAQTVLRWVQCRATGVCDRRGDQHLVDSSALLPRGRRLPVREAGDGPRDAAASGDARADLPAALAVDRLPRARPAAPRGRQARAGRDSAHAFRRPPRGCLPRGGSVPGQRAGGRRYRAAGPPLGVRDGPRLPDRGARPRGAPRPAWPDRARRDRGLRARHGAAVGILAPDTERDALRVPR